MLPSSDGRGHIKSQDCSPLGCASTISQVQEQGEMRTAKVKEKMD
jgi:hypothetical protein